METGVGLVRASYTAERRRDCSTMPRRVCSSASPSMSNSAVICPKPLRTAPPESPRTPSRSMSPVTVEVTALSRTPRAAAMLTMPAVRHAARACSRNSTGIGALSAPVSTWGWSASSTVSLTWDRSCSAPWKSEMVDLLWVPVSQVWRARSRNSPSSGWPFTASRVASSVAVSTPLRGWCAVVVMIPPGVGAGKPSGEGGATGGAGSAAMREVGSAAGWSDGRPARHRTHRLRLEPTRRRDARPRAAAPGPARGASSADGSCGPPGCLHERLRGPPLGEALLTQHRCELVGLGGMGPQGCVLAPGQAEVADDLGGQVLPGGDRRLGALEPEPDPVVDLAPALVEVRRHGRVPEAVRGVGLLPSLGDPGRHGAVVVVPGHPVGAEGDDGRGAQLVDDRGDVVDGIGPVRGGQGTVGIAQPVLLGDAENGQALAHLPLPDGGQLVRRPDLWVVGAVFATGGGEHHHALSRVASGRHQGGGEERLVVGMGPDAEQRPGRGSEGGGGGGGVCVHARTVPGSPSCFLPPHTTVERRREGRRRCLSAKRSARLPAGERAEAGVVEVLHRDAPGGPPPLTDEGHAREPDGVLALCPVAEDLPAVVTESEGAGPGTELHHQAAGA